MRLLKVLFIGLLVAVTLVAGAMVAAVVAAAALLFFFLRRLLTGSKALSASPSAHRQPAPRKPNDSDVIEITATEVNR